MDNLSKEQVLTRMRHGETPKLVAPSAPNNYSVSFPDGAWATSKTMRNIKDQGLITPNADGGFDLTESGKVTPCLSATGK